MALQDIREIAVPITLDKPRTLRFDLNAFAELEEKFGSMDAAFKAMKTGSLKAARFWFHPRSAVTDVESR